MVCTFVEIYNPKQENDERKEQIDTHRLDTHRPTLRKVELNINPLPNIATILLD